MRSYAQYCPIAKGSEILGDRWTLLIVREMLGGASGFNELQRGLPGISRSVLTDRLRSLERAEIVERRTGPKGRTLEYRLTLAGRDLEPVVQAIGEWGATWSFTDPRPEELDPDLLIVWMARHVDREQLPSDRTVVQFDFRNPAKRYWMVLEPSDVSVCLQHPGFDVDLAVRVDTATLYRVYLGRAELGGAMRARKLTLSGPRVSSAPSGAGSPGARSPRPAARPTSGGGRRRDSRAPRGCGSDSRGRRILALAHERGERSPEAAPVTVARSVAYPPRRTRLGTPPKARNASRGAGFRWIAPPGFEPGTSRL